MKPAVFAGMDPGNSSEGYGGLGSKHLEQGDPGDGLKSPGLHVCDHRITQSQGLEGTSGDHLVQSPLLKQVLYSRLHRKSARLVLIISREGDSTD